jgi:hypothetical protein
LSQNGLWDSVQFFLRSTCHAPSVSLHQEALVRLKGGELTRQPTALKNQKFNQKPCQELFSKNRHAKLNSYKELLWPAHSRAPCERDLRYYDVTCRHSSAMMPGKRTARERSGNQKDWAPVGEMAEFAYIVLARAPKQKNPALFRKQGFIYCL